MRSEINAFKNRLLLDAVDVLRTSIAAYELTTKNLQITLDFLEKVYAKELSMAEAIEIEVEGFKKKRTRGAK